MPESAAANHLEAFMRARMGWDALIQPGGQPAGLTNSVRVNPNGERAKPYQTKTGRGTSLSQPDASASGELGPRSATSVELGMHHSDLFEQYLPVKDKPRSLLQDWLSEYFYKTPEGIWRPPASDEERHQKAALRASVVLRRIKRFANALLDGVPPAEQDRPENAVTLADWIRQYIGAGLFNLGQVLYGKGGLQFDELNEKTQLRVGEDHQICVGHDGKVQKVERIKAIGSKGRLPSLVFWRSNYE